VDPRIDKQKLRVAIVVNDGLPDDVSAHSSEVFEDFFMNRKRTQAPTDLPAPLAPPTSIAQGGDLVLYYSAEVPALNRSSIPEYNARKILNGDVFVHGVFFAHEPELSLLKAGAREPVYSQPSEADVPHAWVRNPQVDK